MPNPDPAVDAFVTGASTWRDETAKLREILLDCGLDEALKWRKPCYSFGGGKVAIIQGFKHQCSLMFFKGTLLEDPHGVLVSPGENSQAAMRIEFPSIDRLRALEPVVREYVRAAIALEKAGAKVDFKEKNELVLPDELLARFQRDPALAAAFAALTPGRQRGYNLHFSAAKQSKTRAARIDKYAERILAGKGLNDR